MAQYRFINQCVEINGKNRMVGDVVDESEFRPAEGDSPAEVESLLATQHIELVTA